MLVEAVERLAGLIPTNRILVVTSADLVDLVRVLLPAIPPEQILGEPRAASTAPALTWATWLAAEQDPSATLLSLHADWYVGDAVAFRRAATDAVETAERHDVLVTVGLAPTRPERAYGYIEPGEPLDGIARRVARFVEKPDASRAAQLVAQGALWNSGLFAWTARRFLAETAALAPEIAPHLELLRTAGASGFFHAVTPVAVDVSHFERSGRVAVVVGRFPWDDVGTWGALARVRPHDAQGNVVVGNVIQREARNCILWAEEGTVVVDGVHDLVVVKANGVTLVTTSGRAAQLKTLLETLPKAVRELSS